jgi:hypothetical protein
VTFPATLCDKIWSAHAIAIRAGATLLHVDRHRVHDGSRNAFRQLAERATGITLFSLDNRHIDPFRKDCLLTRVDALGSVSWL